MKASARLFILAAVLLVLFGVFTASLCFVDVGAIGPEDSEVGYSGINAFFRDNLETSALFNTVTDLQMLCAYLLVGFAACFGLYQWITRKSLLKVDPELFALAGFLVCVAACYLLFEKCVVNYRPVLENGALAASYPSSHTLIIVAIFGAAFVMIRRYLPHSLLFLLVQIAVVLFAAFGAVGRLLTGMHWFTDILGGVLLAVALTVLLAAFFRLFSETKASKTTR